MENADEKTETHFEEGNGDITITSKEESSSVTNVKTLSNNPENFLKMEGNIQNENRFSEININHDPGPHSELGAISSTNLINAESTTSSSPLLSEDPLDISNAGNSDHISPAVIDSTKGNVDNSNTTSEYLGKVNGNFIQGDDHQGSGTVEVTPDEIKAEVGGSTSTKGEHDISIDNSENPVHNPTTSGASNEEPSGETIMEPVEEWMDILGSGHLLKKVLKPGIPDSRPQKSDLCILNLIGRLEDGTIVEQSESLEINLSDNEVIQGLDFALALMDKGEEAEVKVSPRFGYGSLGKKPEIPPNSNLHYTVSLLDVKEEPSIHTLDVMERIKVGLKKKERGNWWYSREENTLAINCYRRALAYLDDSDIPEPTSEEDVRKLLDERLKTYNNLGAAQMKISAFDAALMSVNNVLAAQPQNVKALFRKSKILKEKGELQESINVVKQALSIEPESQALQQELSSLMAAQRKVNSKQRELYKKMMGNSSNQNDDEEKKKNSKNNYKTFTMVAAVSFAVAVLGTIVVKYKF